MHKNILEIKIYHYIYRYVFFLIGLNKWYSKKSVKDCRYRVIHDIIFLSSNFFSITYFFFFQKYTLLLNYWKLKTSEKRSHFSYVPYFWITPLYQFQEPECIYQRKLPDLPNQFNFENCKTRMLLVVFVWRTKYGRFSRSPPETLSTKSYWCLMHAVKSTRVSTLCFFRLIHIIICFLSEKLHICFII